MSNLLQHRPSLATKVGAFERMVKLGFKSLWLHRLRSLLTVMGIVFGVCSVIAMLAVGEGASYEAQEQIRKLGSKNIILRSLKPTGQESMTAQRSYVVEYGLTYNDLRRVRDTIPGVQVVVPGRIIRKYLWNATRREDCEIVGTVPGFSSLRHLRLQQGRLLNDYDVDTNRNVCLISQPVAASLFPLSSPIGRKVRVDSDYYEVVGVVEPENVQAPGGDKAAGESAQAMQSRAYIPLSAARSRFGEVLVKRTSGNFSAERVELHEATVHVAREEDVEDTAAIVADILAAHHKTKDFEIVVPLELLRQAERTKQIFNIVLGSIAAISLLVGGIGIMNIMLASVTERTREIGIRRALGAKRRDIVLQFLIETVILSGAGGAIGVLLGLAIPFFISYFAEMRTIVTPGGPILAFSISGAVGIIFGLYPAMRAANLDPVVALRHE